MNLTNYDDIRTLLARHKFRFSKSLGQNFLTAAWVPEDIAASAELDKDTGVLEIGPGIGCLTVELSKLAGKVLSIELDKSLRPILSETLSDCANVDLVFGNALKEDFSELLNKYQPGLRHVVCANLPYNVTTPVLTALIESNCFDTVTVMIQREVARRICSRPGSSDYGAFGIFVQWYTCTEFLFDVPPSCFVPQPKVTSSVIRLKKRASPPVPLTDSFSVDFLFQVVRASFNQRRKTFVNAISSQIPEMTKEHVEHVLSDLGFDTRIRGEVLDISDFVHITEKLMLPEC